MNGLVVRFKRDHRGERRFVVSDAGNHKDLVVSSEGYENADDCVDAARQVVSDRAEFVFDENW